MQVNIFIYIVVIGNHIVNKGVLVSFKYPWN